LEDAGGAVCFNMSHAGNMAAYAFTIGCELGVDIERIRPVPEMADIAARFFAPEEAADLMKLPESDRPLGFFTCWTRKEAYIKAVGDGLSIPLAGFRVTLRPGDPAQLLSLNDDAQAARDWTLHHLDPAPDYVAALAYLDQPRPLVVQPPVAVGGLLVS
jgi:4'-phosphopantetheinyl transferase